MNFPKTFVAVALVGLTGCDFSLSDVLHGFPSCTTVKAQGKDPNTVACECDSAALKDPTITSCCHAGGACAPSTPMSGGMPAPGCKTVRTNGPSVGLVGYSVTTSRGFGFPAACEQFKVSWSYFNSTDTVLPTPDKLGLKPRLFIEQVPPVSPEEVIPLPNPVDAPWKELKPCEIEQKSFTFMGLRPKTDDKHGSFRATLLGLPPPFGQIQANFEVGGTLGGDVCPP